MKVTIRVSGSGGRKGNPYYRDEPHPKGIEYCLWHEERDRRKEEEQGGTVTNALMASPLLDFWIKSLHPCTANSPIFSSRMTTFEAIPHASL